MVGGEIDTEGLTSKPGENEEAGAKDDAGSLGILCGWIVDAFNGTGGGALTGDCLCWSL